MAGKSTKTKPVTIRLAVELAEKLEAEATKRGVSLAALLVLRIERSPAVRDVPKLDANLEAENKRLADDVEAIASENKRLLDDVADLKAGILAIRDELTVANKALAAERSKPKSSNVVHKPAPPKKGSIASLPSVKALKEFRG